VQSVVLESNFENCTESFQTAYFGVLGPTIKISSL